MTGPLPMQHRAGVGLLSLVAAGCVATHPIVADNTYEEAPPRNPIGAEAAEVFTRTPWQERSTPAGKARYQREAHLLLPDASGSFKLGEVAVYAADGSDVQMEYVSDPAGAPKESRVVVRVSVYRATHDLEGEWRSFLRWWHERQSGTLTDPLPLPAHFPSDTKRMAWTLPVADGFGEPAFEERVLLRRDGWFVRYKIACAANARAALTEQILAFLSSTLEFLG